MRKYIFFALITLFCVNLSAQKSYINNSYRALLDKGITLHRQEKFAVSTKCIEDFIATLTPDKNHLLQEAEYYIACNAYQSKAKDAFIKLKNYCQNYPYSPSISRVYFMLGKLYYDKKEYKEALSFYTKINNNDLNNEESNEYLYSRGYSHLVLKDYKSASRYFLPLSAKNQPFEIHATYYYGYSEFCLGNYSSALSAFNKITNESKYYEASSFHTLQIYDRQNDYQNAVTQGEKLIKEYPKSKYSAEAYRILGESSYRNHKWSETAKYLSTYAKLEEKDQRTDLYMLGYAYYKTNNYTAAVSSLGKVTSEKDSIAQNAYIYIGYSHLKNDELQKAQMAFQAASLMDFDLSLREEAAYNYTIAAYQNNSPFGETVAAFERFIKEYPNSKHLDSIYRHLASVYMNEKDYHSALTSINKISNQNSEIRKAKENALFHIGVSHFIKDEYNEAINYFNLSIKEYNPASFSAQAFLWRGEAYYRLNNIDKAKDDIITFLSKTQKKTLDNTVKAYYTLGYTAFQTKNYTEAEKWFSKLRSTRGAERHRLYTDVLNRLADCHYNRRDFESARKVYASVPPRSPVADYAAFQNAFILGIQKQYTDKINALQQLITNYHNSSYRDNALYEIGRTYIIMGNYDKAIENYSLLQKDFSKSPLARKAALETGMLYANMNKPNQAVSSFKQVIEKYPNSEETRIALESLQSLYVEINKVEDYLAYRESIAGTTISNVAKSQEDSLSFIAAEKVFEREQYQDAIQSLYTYFVKYCDKPTLNCITATFYLAESHYALGDKTQALRFYDNVINKEGNIHMETALLKGAEIAYEQELYPQANNYFKLLEQSAEIRENVAAAILGQLRCNYKLQQHQATVNMANTIINNTASSATHIREARYCKVKALVASARENEAIPDLKILSADLQYDVAAEAIIIHANILYAQKQYTQSEQLIADFIAQNTSHQYWIARAFITLADIYIAQNDDFMAKQYLMSLKENYTSKDDDISGMINNRMDGITEREQKTIEE